MVSLCHCKWTWIPLIVLSVLAIAKSEKFRERVSRLSRRNQQRHLISGGNHQNLPSNNILSREKRSPSTSAETNMITVEGLPFDNKTTLLDLEEPALLNDFEKSSNSEDSTNDTHIRVKRSQPNFNLSVNPESFIHFDNNYLDDLVDSFPKSPDEQHWTFKKRHIGSSNYEISNSSNYRDLSFNSNLTSAEPSVNDIAYYLNKNVTDSMTSNIYNKDDEERIANFSRIINSIDSTENNNEPYKIRIKREKKHGKNMRRKVLHGKKIKLKKHAGKKDKNKGASSKRAGQRVRSNSSKMTSSSKGKRKDHVSKNNFSNLLDDYQTKSKEKKREFNDYGSEIDIDSNDKEFLPERTKNDEGAAVDDGLRDKRSLYENLIVSEKEETSSRISHVDKKQERSRTKRNEDKDLTLFKYQNESTSSSVSISPESEVRIPAEKPRDNRAVKSIEEIKELAEKLVTKVNELQNFLSYENQRENRQGSRKKLESREIEIPRVNNATPFEEEVVLEAPKLVDECVRIGDLHSALKTLNDGRNVSLEGNTSNIEIATEGINLSNDRAGPLTKRMARKGRIKRKSRRKWGRWTGWSSCSVTCGKGRQIRWRHCLRDCSTVETEMEEKSCQLPACPPGKFLGIF